MKKKSSRRTSFIIPLGVAKKASATLAENRYLEFIYLRCGLAKPTENCFVTICNSNLDFLPCPYVVQFARYLHNLLQMIKSTLQTSELFFTQIQRVLLDFGKDQKPQKNIPNHTPMPSSFFVCLFCVRESYST